MDQLLRQLPPRVLAIGALIIGLLFIVLNDPPKTVCDSQLDLFRDSQKRFLFTVQEKGVTRRAQIERELEVCKRGNTPGSCYELFDGLKRMSEDLENVPNTCRETAAEIGEIKRGVWEGLELMVLLAWGEKPPLTYVQRSGWLDSADVALFCRLKQRAIDLYGTEAWNAFRVSTNQKLPQAIAMSPEQIWQRSLMSTTCDNYR